MTDPSCPGADPQYQEEMKWTVRRRLLEVLADPATGGPLSLVDDDGADSVEQGELVSASGQRFPIVGGIPRFVPRENYSQSFGLQWNRFAGTQLDSATGASYSRRRFEAEAGWGPDEIGGNWVVDAGCGAGRFAEIAADQGAEVLAVDLSSAVDAVHANLGHRPNVHVVQADIRKLPFQADRVRHLYSLGVLQHTPEPLATARALVGFLPPGGSFALTIYARQPWTKLYSKYWFRPITTRLAPEKLLRIIERCMPVVFPVTSALFASPRLGRAFQFALPVANYVDRRDLAREVRYNETILDTFDMLAPKFDRPVTARELEQSLSGLADRLDFVTRVPVVVRGTR